MDKIQEICDEYNPVFDYRISVTAFGATRIYGYLKDTTVPVMSKHEERRSRKHSGSKINEDPWAEFDETALEAAV